MEAGAGSEVRSGPAPLWYLPIGRIWFLDLNGEDVRDAWTIWCHTWHDVGVMWYYDGYPDY